MRDLNQRPNLDYSVAKYVLKFATSALQSTSDWFSQPASLIENLEITECEGFNLDSTRHIIDTHCQFL